MPKKEDAKTEKVEESREHEVSVHCPNDDDGDGEEIDGGKEGGERTHEEGDDDVLVPSPSMAPTKSAKTETGEIAGQDSYNDGTKDDEI